MAEMKTLNGYEVVDKKARERLDTLVIPTKTSQLENDSQFTNKTYVDNAVASVDVSAQLTEYAKKTELPTKVSQLQNDAGYLTEHQSLAGYATETYVNNKVAEIDVTTYATKQEVTAVENKIPSLDGYATKQELTAVENKIPSLTGYATEAYVDGKIAEIPGTDLSNYYNKEQTNSAISTAIAGITIPTKTSELTNDSNFVTETELENKGYLTAVPAEYVTETELDQKGYLTEHQSLADYATKTYVDNAIANIPAGGGSTQDNFYIDASGFTTFSQNVPAPQAVIDLVTYFKEHGHACVYLKDTQDALYYPAIFANPETDYYLLVKSGTNWNTISSGSEIKWDTISIQKTFDETWVWQSINSGAVTLARKSDIPSTDTFVTNETLEQKGYLTAVPDTYALKTDIPDVSSFTTMAAVEAKGYQTASDVNTLINNALGVIENGTY